MLDESSVPYVSVPLEDGEVNICTTREAPTASGSERKDCFLAFSVVTLIVMIIGTLALITTVALRSSGVHDDPYYDSALSYEYSNGLASRPPNYENKGDNVSDQLSENVTIKVSTEESVESNAYLGTDKKPSPDLVNGTDKPIYLSTANPVNSSSSLENGVAEIELTILSSKEEEPEFNTSLVFEENMSSGNTNTNSSIFQSNQVTLMPEIPTTTTTTTSSTTTTRISHKEVVTTKEGYISKEEEDSINSVIENVYGDKLSKPNTYGEEFFEDGGYYTSPLSGIMAVLGVGLAILIIIVGAAWAVKKRIDRKRRRNRIETVITDLQARDRVVLLNSEDSDD